jgi:hypothetical protein
MNGRALDSVCGTALPDQCPAPGSAGPSVRKKFFIPNGRVVSTSTARALQHEQRDGLAGRPPGRCPTSMLSILPWHATALDDLVSSYTPGFAIFIQAVQACGRSISTLACSSVRRR